MKILKNNTYRTIFGAIIGIAFGFLIDLIYILTTDDDFIAKSDTTSQFFLGTILLLIMPAFVTRSIPIAWGLIGALAGYYASDKKYLRNVIIFFAILILISTILGWSFSRGFY